MINYKNYLGLEENQYINWNVIYTSFISFFGGPLYSIKAIDEGTRYISMYSEWGYNEFLVTIVRIPELNNRLEVQIISAKDGRLITSLDSSTVDYNLITNQPIPDNMASMPDKIIFRYVSN